MWFSELVLVEFWYVELIIMLQFVGTLCFCNFIIVLF